MRKLFTLFVLASSLLLQTTPMEAQRQIPLRKIKAVKQGTELTLLDSIISDTRRKIYQYNEYGYITSVMDYNLENGTWTLDTDNSYRQEYVFDANGQCTDRTSYRVDRAGNKTIVKDRGCITTEDGLTWERYYDEFENGKCHIDEAYAYDQWDNLVVEIDYGYDSHENAEFIREYKERAYTGKVDAYADHYKFYRIKQNRQVYELHAVNHNNYTMNVADLQVTDYKKNEWKKEGNKLYYRTYTIRDFSDITIKELEANLQKEEECEYTLNAAGTRPVKMVRRFDNNNDESYISETIDYQWDDKDRPVEITYHNGSGSDATRRELFTYADDYSRELSLLEAIDRLDDGNLTPEDYYMPFGHWATTRYHNTTDGDDTWDESSYTWNANGQLVGGTWKETETSYEPGTGEPRPDITTGEVRVGYHANGHMAWMIEHNISEDEYFKKEYIYNQQGLWTDEREYSGDSFDGPWKLEPTSKQQTDRHRAKRQTKRSAQFIDDMSEGRHEIDQKDEVWHNVGYYFVSDGVVTNGRLEQCLISNASLPHAPEDNYTDPLMPLSGPTDEWDVNLEAPIWEYRWNTTDNDWECIYAPVEARRIYTKDGCTIFDRYDKNKHIISTTVYHFDSEGRLTKEEYSNSGNKTYEYLPGTNYLLQSVRTTADGTRNMCNYFYSKHNYVTPTGIGNVTTTTSSPTCYDLQGRRISHPAAHGIYIINGKKVIR